MTHSLAA